jgi:hypothetical protein
MTNDKLYIFKEWRSLYQELPKHHLFNLIGFPKTGDAPNTIGYSLPHVKESNYNDIFSTVLKDKLYSVLFMDGSIITMYYRFDNQDNIHSANLHFLPNPNIDSEDSDILNIFSAYTQSDILSKYVRIDFDDNGYEKFFHGYVHLHSTLNKNGPRFSLDSWLSPLQFIEFILITVYKQSVFELQDTYAKRQLLTSDELKKLHFKTTNNYKLPPQ